MALRPDEHRGHAFLGGISPTAFRYVRLNTLSKRKWTVERARDALAAYDVLALLNDWNKRGKGEWVYWLE